MTLTDLDPDPQPIDPPPSRARRRRQQRSLLPDSQNERSNYLEAIAHQLTPSYDFYLSSLLAGLLLVVALITSAPALLILAILFSPFLGPVIGLGLSTATGSLRFFWKSLTSYLAAALIIFGFGALSGAIAPIIRDSPVAAWTAWNSYDWTNFLVIAIGVGLCVYTLVRSPRQRPLVASVAIAYGLIPPLAAAGFNLTAVVGVIWLQSLLVAGIHLAWAVVVAIAVFIMVGLNPRTLLGYLFTALLVGILVAALVSARKPQMPAMGPEPTNPPVVFVTTLTPTTMVTTPAPEISAIPRDPTATFTPTITFLPTGSPTSTITPQPTPVWARVSAPTGGGAYLRDAPDGKILSSILNGNMLEVISEPMRGNNGVIWVQVRTEDGFVGWIVQSLLATATPSVGW